MQATLSQSTIFEMQKTDMTLVDKYIDLLIGPRQNNPDFLVLEAIKKQSIGIKEIKELISWVQLKPFSSKSKVALVKTAEKLTLQAQNSLLKTLEEPPNSSYIMLVTRNHKHLLPTINSRCQLIRLNFEDKTAGLETDIPLKNTLKNQIKWIDQINSLDSIERKDKIESILKTIHEQVLVSVDQQKAKKNLKLIEQSQNALKRNVNTKLLLENLLFNYST